MGDSVVSLNMLVKILFACLVGLASGLQESPLQHAPTILTAAWCLQDMPGPCLSTLQESGLQPVLTTPTALLRLPPKATPTLLATPRVCLVPSAPTTPTAT